MAPHSSTLLPGKSHGWRSLVSFNPLSCWESDTTERLHFHFSLSCTGEGNGNPLQCSCLENPRDGGVWWATIYGVAQSRTQLKRFSSSSSSELWNNFKQSHIFIAGAVKREEKKYISEEIMYKFSHTRKSRFKKFNRLQVEITNFRNDSFHRS